MLPICLFLTGHVFNHDSSMFLILGNILALCFLPIIPAPAQRSQGRTLSVGSASWVLHLEDMERAARPPSGCLWVREIEARGQALKYRSSECNPTRSEVLGLHFLPYTGKETGDNVGCLPGPNSTAAAAGLPEPGLERMVPAPWAPLPWASASRLTCIGPSPVTNSLGAPLGICVHLAPRRGLQAAPS